MELNPVSSPATYKVAMLKISGTAAFITWTTQKYPGFVKPQEEYVN